MNVDRHSLEEVLETLKRELNRVASSIVGNGLCNDFFCHLKSDYFL